MVLRRILNSVLGTESKPKAAGPFVYLDVLKDGLAARAEVFLTTGEDRQLLAEIGALMVPNPAHKPGAGPQASRGTNLLCFDQGGHPDRLARYGELRHAMKWGVNKRPTENGEHLEAIPDTVYTLLACSDLHQRAGIETPTTWSDLREAVKILGGCDADIIAFCLPTERYTQRSISVALEPGETLYGQFTPASFITALDRCTTKTRTRVLERLAKADIVKAPGFLPYIFQLAHENSAGLRKIAGGMLSQHDDDTVTALATELLPSKKAAARLFAIQALGGTGTPAALDALKAHKENEKSQSVLTTLDLFVGAPASQAQTVESGYIDLNGAHVSLPPDIDLVDDGSSPLDDSFTAKLRLIEEKIEQEVEAKYVRGCEYWANSGKNYPEPKRGAVHPFAQRWFTALNAPVGPITADERTKTPFIPSQQRDAVIPIVEAALDQIPLRRAIDLACRNTGILSSLLGWRNDPRSVHVQNAIADGRVSFAQVIKLAIQNEIVPENSTPSSPDRPTSFEARYLMHVISSKPGHYSTPKIMPGIWQIASDQLSILVDALPPRGSDIGMAQRALEVIADFPSLPMDLIQPLLFVAIDDRARLRDPAQKLLVNAPGIDAPLIAILADKRQGVRANAARFLADRGATDAIPALAKRLKTEKSELARADFISAVSRLGGDTKPYLGRDALLKEAQKFVEKLPSAKLYWLSLSSAPSLQWADGTSADPVLLDAWLRLALKLKSPLGSPLFGLYLDQMKPQSVTAVADWVLNSWINYDIDRPVGDAARANAEKKAKAEIASNNSWMVHVGYTLEQMTDEFLDQQASGYPNSGADSKGVLALTHRATPSKAGPLIANYLKQHGKRVSQAKALVETLFGMGSQDAVQVLVATTTRFKQRTVRELADTLVKDLAEARGWTEDELADRSVPTGGFEDDGTLLLEVGEDAKPYVAKLGSDLTVKLFNPTGKEVKSVPAGTDENTKEAKSLLSAAKKTIKTAHAQQQARLYGAMVSTRVWARQTWQDDLTKHPIMQRLIERVIWRGLGDKGELITALRLTPEGEVLNGAGDDVDMSAISKIDIAHTANLPEADRAEWLDHLKDFEVKPLFAQVSRPLRVLTDEQKKDTKLTDREGWMMTTFKIRTASKKAGYERGPILDGGGFEAYRKEFRGAGIWADLYFTGSYVPEEDQPAAIKHVQFTQINDDTGGGRALALEKVPALLLSEVWNDLHEIAKPGAFDEDWEAKGLY